MQAAQTAGIDLPLKALVWQDANGVVNLTYNDPSWIAARHELDSKVSQAVFLFEYAPVLLGPRLERT